MRRVSPARIPRLLGVAVIAFAQFENRPLLGAVELFRGLSIQFTYRWATCRLLADADDKAVLLWSGDASLSWRLVGRELFGVVIAALVGLVQLFAASAILVVPAAIALVLSGDAGVVVLVVLSILIVRMLLNSGRAIDSYRQERRLATLLPHPSSPRVHIDVLAALPARNGHGGRLLATFLEFADRHSTEVVLHCDGRNLAFYQRYGFYDCAPGHSGRQRVMLREARRFSSPVLAASAASGV